MSKQAIDELKERLNNIDVRLGKGATNFKWVMIVLGVQTSLLLALLAK
jgi:hypothetical protein